MRGALQLWTIQGGCNMSTIKPGYTRPLDFRHGRIEMSHGSGGRAMEHLITELFAAAFDNPYLAQGNDGALLPQATGRLVMSTDSHVVSPLFFAGGDIGCLWVPGPFTVVRRRAAGVWI